MRPAPVALKRENTGEEGKNKIQKKKFIDQEIIVP
jgi:hypothetical protein